MSEPLPPSQAGQAGQARHEGREGGRGQRKRRTKPVPLLFEPHEQEAGPEHFFDLESIDDPRVLLERSTELALAFREAADRATEFQAVAAALLADPRRFDQLPVESIAESADWTPDYARRMVEFGRDLIRNGHTGY